MAALSQAAFIERLKTTTEQHIVELLAVAIIVNSEPWVRNALQRELDRRKA